MSEFDSDANDFPLQRSMDALEIGRARTKAGTTAIAKVVKHPCIFNIFMPDWEYCPMEFPSETHQRFTDNGEPIPMFRDRIEMDVYVQPNPRRRPDPNGMLEE